MTQIKLFYIILRVIVHMIFNIYVYSNQTKTEKCKTPNMNVSIKLLVLEHTIQTFIVQTSGVAYK